MHNEIPAAVARKMNMTVAALDVAIERSHKVEESYDKLYAKIQTKLLKKNRKAKREDLETA